MVPAIPSTPDPWQKTGGPWGGYRDPTTGLTPTYREIQPTTPAAEQPSAATPPSQDAPAAPENPQEAATPEQSKGDSKGKGKGKGKKGKKGKDAFTVEPQLLQWVYPGEVHKALLRAFGPLRFAMHSVGDTGGFDELPAEGIGRNVPREE